VSNWSDIVPILFRIALHVKTVCVPAEPAPMTPIRPSSSSSGSASRISTLRPDRAQRLILVQPRHSEHGHHGVAMNFSTLPPCSSRIAGHVATMATLGVRSRSLAGEWRSRNPLNEAVQRQRTDASGCSPVAMQKVEGSSPFIR
jgi:hypothetical protein